MIQELIDTESNYVGVLHVLQDSFMIPMSKVLSKEILDKIFPCIPELVGIHDHFLARLREATALSPTVRLSDVFLEARKPFLVYAHYCSSLSNPKDMLDGISRENPEFKQLLKVSKFILDQNIAYLLGKK